MESLLTIGVFARAAGLSASALRHYDAEGLLTPALIDESTGYRYYDARQQETAALIAKLRAAGTPLADMRRVIAVTGLERAQLLDRLADERVAEAARAAALMRDEATRARNPIDTATAAVTWPDLSAAMELASRFCGAPPFDRVVLAIEEGRVRCLATDRYRLADIPVVATEVTGHAQAQVRLEEMRNSQAGLEGRQPAPRCLVLSEEPRFGDTVLTSEPRSRIPDLPRLSDSFLTQASRHGTFARSDLHVDSSETATIDSIAGLTIRLRASYVESAFDALQLQELEICAASDRQPVVFQRTGETGPKITIMPLAPTSPEEPTPAAPGAVRE